VVFCLEKYNWASATIAKCPVGVKEKEMIFEERKNNGIDNRKGVELAGNTINGNYHW